MKCDLFTGEQMTGVYFVERQNDLIGDFLLFENKTHFWEGGEFATA